MAWWMIYISTEAKQCPKGVWFSGFVVASFQQPPLVPMSKQRISWQWTTFRSPLILIPITDHRKLTTPQPKQFASGQRTAS